MNGWRDEFWPLVDCAEDALPSVELAAQFEDALSADESARRLYLEHVQLQADIFLLLRSRRTLDKTLHQIDQLRAAPPNPPSRLPAFVTAGLKSLSQPLHFSLFFSAVTILSLALFFAQVHWRPSDVSSPPHSAVEQAPRPVVARLGRAREVVWADSARPLADRAFLRAGERLTLRSGWVEVDFDSGASLLLAGPADFCLSAPNGGELRRGKVLARVPPPAVGFRVATPQAEVIDLGTEFALRVDESGPMQVSVFDGRVEVVPHDSQPPRIVNAGQTLAAAGDAEWRLASKAPPSAFVRLREQRAALSAEKPGVRFRVSWLPPGSGEESLAALGRFEAGLNVGREAPTLVVNGLAFADAKTAASQAGVTLTCNVLNVGGRLEKDLPSRSWKGPLAELMSSGAGSPIGGKFDVSVGGLTVGQGYTAVFYCAHAIGVRGKRTMQIVSGEDASAFFEISAANLELCPIYVVAARFTATEPAQIFTLQADARSRAVVCGVAIFSHD